MKHGKGFVWLINLTEYDFDFHLSTISIVKYTEKMIGVEGTGLWV